MKVFSLILSMFAWSLCFSQHKIAGQYRRQDSRILLNEDSTFRFFHSVDTYRGWAKGAWHIVRGNTISLTPVPVYDTMTMVDANGDPRDSIFLSEDENATRKKKTRMRVMRVFQYEQNFELCPTTLLYKKGRLYVIQHGRRQKKKIRNGYYIEPFVPWYVRSID
ncbi:MAG TPA: hypothetical protein VF408_07560 [Sediminibacterium sp.]